jgi:hypothetical protein
MRLSSFLPPTLVGLLVLGCAGDPAGPSARPISASGDLAFTERTQLVDWQVFSECTGEDITFTGTLHEVFSFTVTGTGAVKATIHFQTHAVATSPTTGDPMVLNMIETFIIPDLDSFFEGTDEFTYVFVTKGGAPNEVVRVKYHLTITPNGTITSSFDDITISCK